MKKSIDWFSKDQRKSEKNDRFNESTVGSPPTKKGDWFFNMEETEVKRECDLNMMESSNTADCID